MKIRVSIGVLALCLLAVLLLAGTALGEYQSYSGTNNSGELVRGQPIEINFDNPKFVSKVYIETGCESEIAIYGNIQFYDGFGDSQISVLKIPFSKVMCGDTINVEQVIKTTKVKLLMTQALPPPYGGMSQPEYKVSLTTWKVYADDIVPPPEGSASGASSGQPSGQSASVSLTGDKTDVVLGEDILLKLSAVNLITKPKMHVQVIIIPPSGMSVTSSEFSKSGTNQFTANYELEPGDGKDIEVKIKPNQIGDFNVNGRIIYYFGDEKEKAEDHTLPLPIKVRKEVAPQQGQTQAPNSNPSSAGFEAIISISGILLVSLLKKKW